MKANPLSRTVITTVSFISVVIMVFFGTLTNRIGTLISFSYVSSSVMDNQNDPLSNKKNKNIRNSLLTILNRKFLISELIRLISEYIRLFKRS